MSVLNATDVIIYIRNNHSGSNNMLLACMQNSVVNIDNEFLDITTKGDGKVGGLLQSGYSGTMQGSGVMQVEASDVSISGQNLLKTTLEGNTCMITYTAGSLNFYVNAKIASLSFQSNVGSLWKFSATFQFTSEIARDAAYDIENYYLISSRVYRRVSTTTESSFTESTLAGLTYGSINRFVISKNGVVMSVVALFNPSEDNEVIYTTATGEFEFDAPLVDGDVISILYW
jgi:hypothetical protein